MWRVAVSNGEAMGLLNDGQKPRVLIVEDHGDTRRVLAILVSQQGFAVDQAASVSEAIEKLDGQSNVILDLRCPTAPAPTCCGRFAPGKSPCPWRSSPPKGAANSLNDALAFAPNLYLRKPIDMLALLRWLKPPDEAAREDEPPLNPTEPRNAHDRDRGKSANRGSPRGPELTLRQNHRNCDHRDAAQT